MSLLQVLKNRIFDIQVETSRNINVFSLKELYKQYGFSFFENGDFNLNIFAFRSINNKVTNTFDDKIGVAYKSNGEWKTQYWDCTTRAGDTYMSQKLMNKKGTAILVSPKQYKSKFSIGLHQGKYEALIQNSPITVWRDSNLDGIYDQKGKVYEGMFGIHIHKAGINSKKIDNWSAGCVVFQKEKDFNNFMKLVNISKNIYGNKFTFSLF